MATSGTAVWNPEIRDVIEEAYERAGAEMRTGYELRTAIRTLNFLLADWANRGFNLWTVEQMSLSTVIGQATYTLEADTVDVTDATIRIPGQTPTTDIYLERISVSDYAQIVNKDSRGRPIQYYVQRLTEAPEITFWLVPDQIYIVTYWRLRRMQDAGTAVNTLDVPFRFIEAMTAGLAYRVAIKKQKPLDVIASLKTLYDEAWQMAADEDRDRASSYFIPSDPMQS